MKRIVVVFLIVLVETICFAQTNEDQAKMLFFAAEDAYNTENYSQCIEKLNNIEKLLGSTNSKVLELTIKAYYYNEEYVNAYIAKTNFFKITNNAYPGYNNVLRISNEIDEKAIPLLVKEGKAAFKSKDYKSAIFCLEKTYLNEPDNIEIAYVYLQSVIQINIDVKSVKTAKQKLETIREKLRHEEDLAYKMALESNSTVLYDNFLAKYSDEIFSNEITSRKKELEDELALVKLNLAYSKDLKLVIKSGNYYSAKYFLEKYCGSVHKEDIATINNILETEKSSIAVARVFIGEIKDKKWTVEYNGKWGVINSKGEEITQINYDKIFNFSDGIAQFMKYGKKGYLDYEGNEIVLYNGEYSDAGSFSEHMTYFEKNSKYGCIDIFGNIVIEPIYDNVSLGFSREGAVWIEFSEGLACVKRNGKWGSVNKKGEEVIKPIYDKIYSFSNGKATVVLNGEIKTITYDTEKIKLSINMYSLEPKCINKKYGFVDGWGITKIEYNYQYAGEFQEGLAVVKMKGKYGFINEKGEMVIECKYDDVGGFNNGIAAVCIKKKWALINKEGKEITDFKYDYIKI